MFSYHSKLDDAVKVCYASPFRRYQGYYKIKIIAINS